MSFKAQFQALENQTAHVHALEAKVYAERDEVLAALPYQFGYPNLPSFIKAVRAAYNGEKPKKRKTKNQTVRQSPSPIGQGLAKSVPPKAPEPILPTGTNLDDPANYGVLPDTTLLNLDRAQDPSARARLAEALAYAGRVLHTSKIPAVVWREWRSFERQATELLRVANATVPHVS